MSGLFLNPNPIVPPVVLKIIEYLTRRRARMNVGIGFVLKLPGHEPAMLLGKLDGLVDHSYSALSSRRHNDLRSEKAHELASLDAKWFCHSKHKRISLRRANHCETDTGISACRLYDCLARLKLARLFGRLDYPESQSVLHRTKRVESFNLDENVYS